MFAQPIRILSLAFPNDRASPARRLEPFDGPTVALDVGVELVLPELCACLRCRRAAAAFVSMPEATVDENREPVARQHDVRGPWEITAMEPKAEAVTMEETADRHFRGGIAAANPRHEA